MRNPITQFRSMYKAMFGKNPEPMQADNSTRLEMVNDWQNVFVRRKSYEDDIVAKACIATIARHTGKLSAHLVNVSTGRKVDASGDIDTLREILQLQPNPYHTIYDLQYRMAADAVSTGNAYASIKRAADGIPLEIWPLDCANVEPREVDGAVYLRFTFKNGKRVTLPYTDVLHIRHNFTSGDFIAHDESNLEQQLALLNTLEQSFENSAVNSGRIRGVVKINGTIGSDLWHKKADLITAQLKSGAKDGIVATDQTLSFDPINTQPQAADHTQLDYVRDNIYRFYGCSAAIVSGEYTEPQWTAFYESTIEPLAIQFAQEFTRKLLTPAQRAQGYRIVFDTDRLAYATLKDKAEFLKNAAPTGALTVNDIAEIIGMSPPLSDDVRIQSLNYVDASIANQYQLHKQTTGGENDDG